MVDGRAHVTDWQRAPYREVDIWQSAVNLETRADGAIVLRSPYDLACPCDNITQRLEHWATVRPDQTFIARREAGGNWRRVTYAQTLSTVKRIAGHLIQRGLSAERPIVILSQNSIEHQMLALAAMYVGIPSAPISTAYSLASQDFAKLRSIVQLLTPGLVFADQPASYARAIDFAVPHETEVLTYGGQLTDRPPSRYETWTSTCSDFEGSAAAANRTVGADTIARFLFTSGSTGTPKAVINTQRMLCANQAMIAHAFPFLIAEPPEIVDWLPWSHTFGGNHNVGIILYNGGTLYIDDGRPSPGFFDTTIRNLREISPTVYFNVPKGFEMLVSSLQRDPQLRRKFFSRLTMNFFAGASLAPHVWDALDQLSFETTGKKVVMMTGLGATETGPSATFCTRGEVRPGSIGLPVPGVEIKLVATGGKLEARVKGPAVTPGYWRQPDLTAGAYDEEGYYCLGDAVRFADVSFPGRGLVFDGRIAEDFKLATGTWVSVGPLRSRAIVGLAPFARDVVVTGLDRDSLAVIMIPDADACRAACLDLSADAPLALVWTSGALHDQLKRRLALLARDATGSATRITRLVILPDALSIDAGEITDKGSINQRAVLERRRSLVEDLYKIIPPPPVITLEA